MTQAVFLSYARSTSRQYAEALHKILEGQAFLDTSDIEAGEQFPKALVDALLNAKIVVVFVSEMYFQRWYCRRELEFALKPFQILINLANQSEQNLNAALDGLVLALPPHQKVGTFIERLLYHLPPRLRTTDWPTADDSSSLADLVNQRLGGVRHTVGEHLESLNQIKAARKELLEESALPPAADFRSIPHYLPGMPVSLKKRFVGRANELWQLHTKLDVFEGGGLPQQLPWSNMEDLARLGSQPNTEYVSRFGPQTFSGGVFWISADVNEGTLESDFHEILKTINKSLNIETPDLKTLRESGRQVKEELGEALNSLPANQRVLFVIDNVPETPPKALSTWCPTTSTATVLATSRRKLSIGEAGLEEIIIQPLSQSAGVDLLTQKLNHGQLTNEAWQDIAGWVGGLPLALEILNKALQAGGVTPKELRLKAIQSHPTVELDAQLEALKEEIPPGTLRGVTEALKISYDQLSAETQEVAHLLAHLSPEPIPYIILETLGQSLVSPKVKNALRSRSIVMPVVGITQHQDQVVPLFGTIHQVLADFLRSQTKEKAKNIHIMGQILLNIMQPDTCRDPNQWAVMTACVPHAEEIQRLLFNLQLPQYAETCARLGLGFQIFYGAQGLYHRAREQGRKNVSYAITWLGKEHPLTLTFMSNLAVTLSDQGDLAEAADLQQRLLKVQRRTLGKEHPSTLSTLNNLAANLSEQGDLAEAADLQRTVLEVQRRTLGEEHLWTLTTLNNLAATLMRQGDLPGAADLQRTVLEVQRRTLGKEHFSTSTTAMNYWDTLRRMGKREAALNVLRQDLAWLLERDISSLSGNQRVIRNSLALLPGLQHGDE